MSDLVYCERCGKAADDDEIEVGGWRRLFGGGVICGECIDAGWWDGIGDVPSERVGGG